MKAILLRLPSGLFLLALSLVGAGCGSDFYLSESETAAYAGMLSTEASANSFIMSSISNQVLDIQFDNNSQPPSIRYTNLVTLMRDYTTLGAVEGINHQVQLDRLNDELQRQIERWIRKELQIYMGSNNAGVRLSHLESIQVRFLDRPTFTFRPERQAIDFSLNVRLTINGTIEVDVLDDITDFFFDINGSYPLSVDINDFSLSGEASLRQTFADAAEIALNITPQPGAITVSDNGSSAPGEVKDGVRALISQQLSQPLTETFRQRYDYFALTGLGLTQGSAQAPSTLQYTYRANPEVARPVLHIIGRTTDGKLSHLRKTEGGQGLISSVQPFPNLQTRVENEPVLFASAADQLELAATTTANELIYAHWRDEAWITQTTFVANGAAQGYTGKPALIASQPGQVEIIAVGRDGGLYHLRRLNGRWLAPVAVPLSGYGSFATPPFRDPVAGQSGNKFIVVFVDSQNRLLAIAFDLESGLWGQPAPVSTQEAISFAPTAAASGEGRVDVVYVGTSGTPYHRVLEVSAARFLPNVGQTGISIAGAETSIGGRLNSAPTLVCSSYKEVELVGRGTDDRLYHNHFVGPASPYGAFAGRMIAQGWQGWNDLNGNFAGSFTFERMSALSAAATRTGKVVVAAIRQPSILDNDTQQFIYHNTYDSERFGTQLWKTVLWRGHEKVGSQRFVGQLALAVTDRHIGLAYVNSNWTLQGARLNESNATSFASFSNNQINSAGTPSHPVMVSSVAGQTDIVLIGNDGRMRHVRRSSRGALYSFTFAAPFEQVIPVQPSVVGYGNGQLEIVALASNNTLYHWRHQNGAWTQATQLSGTAISQPVLVNVGSGQLLVFAVGSDQVLYLWSFTNGTWTSPLQISTGFPVNGALFGPLAASSWGEGSVDLALVSSQTGAVYHGRIGPGYFTPGVNLGLTPSRNFTRVGGIVVDTPILTAFSSTRLSLLAIGTDQWVYSNWSSLDYANPIFPSTQAPPIVWGNYRPIGGANLLMGGVARTGANELTALGIDPEGRLFVSRFNGATWSQFQPITGQNPQMQLSPPRYRPSITTFTN